MKRFYTVCFLLILLVTQSGFSQERTIDDDRTLETKIADLLNEMPADNIGEKDAMMQNMIALGEEGILGFTKLLNPPEEGGDASVRYALGSLAKYVSGAEAKEHRNMVSNSLLRALERQTNPAVKTFLMERLQKISGDEAVPVLEKYLTDPELTDPAAMALVEIGSPKAEEALAGALESSNTQVLLAVTNALGELETKDNIETISKIAGENSGELRKVALHTLALSGSPEAEDILLEASEDNNFRYAPGNATASLLIYVNRLGEEGHVRTMEKLVDDIMKECDEKELVHIRTQALSSLVTFKQEDALDEIIDALDSPYMEYRRAALSFTFDMQGDEVQKELMEAYEDHDDEVKSELIHAFAERGDLAAISLVQEALQSENQTLRLASIPAMTKLAGKNAVPGLMSLLQSGKSAEVSAVKKALMTLPAKDFLPQVSKQYNNYPTVSKIAALELIKAKLALQYEDMVLQQAKESQIKEIRMSAWNTLAQIAQPSSLSKLFKSFDNINDREELKAIGNVIQSMVNRSANKKELLSKVGQNIARVSTEKQEQYLGLFPGMGSKEALSTLMDVYADGSPQLRMEVVRTLNQWNNAWAFESLSTIIQKEDEQRIRNEAFEGALNLVSGSRETEAQKLLYYRELMSHVTSASKKKEVLKEIGNISTFPALAYCGEYLDKPVLGTAAAKAMASIVAAQDNPDKEMTGKYVYNLLEKAADELDKAGLNEEKSRVAAYLRKISEEDGFYPLFNGKDLSKWQGLVANPVARAGMSEETLRMKQKEANERMRKNWKVQDGELVFTGQGKNITTIKDYRNFEMYVDWKIGPEGDAGIYLRGTPQVQIWDTSRTNVGAQVGSGGLYNNKNHRSTPLVVADNPVGEWNTFRIRMIGDKVSVWLNGQLVVDEVVMENYWEPEKSIYPEGPIELQAHGTKLYFRDIFVKELPSENYNKLTKEEKQEGFVKLFNGENLENWVGDKSGYVANNGMITFKPEQAEGGLLFTEDQYGDFVFRFEFQLTPGANNGLAIRSPLEGNPAYDGMELQILDNTANIYKNLHDYQYHGSVYGVIPAKRGYLKPIGEWNEEEVYIRGSYIRIKLNGTTILEGDLEEASKGGTMDGKNHPGLERDKGHIGFFGHGSFVQFRNIRLKNLD